MFWIGQLGEIRMKRFWMMTAFCAFLPLGQAQAQVQAQAQAQGQGQAQGQVKPPAQKAPPSPGSTLVARLSPSRKVLRVSNFPSPSRSSRIVMRSAPRVWRGGGGGTRSNSARMYWS